ncbi:DNA polymerase III subunit delta [Kurthia huakuii]|uniref:DNA polymerase III subunit delta n=1 Tax=Kurthia huakuii TaxID=1421019 RepID=UPI000497386A|nr:DNA polymerase III subunit delta [Kurthia huakuii]MBM7697950.1 DNA polymerase-3 subunit delta [Kurthia huakuii]
MFQKVWKEIANGHIEPVYVIAGEESYFIDETLQRLKDKLAEQGELDIMNYDLDEQLVDEVIDEADTIPFFSDRKLVVAKNASFLKATEKGKEKLNHDLKKLERFLQFPSETSVTVFIAPYAKLDERKKVTKQMKEHALYLFAETPKERDLAVWAKNEVVSRGAIMNDNAIAQLIEMVGMNMLHLRTEIEKLALYVADTKELIEPPLVEAMVAKTLEQDVFKLLNAYIRGDRSTALSIYHDLLRQKEEPIALVALISSQVRLMSNVYYLLSKGYHPQQISKQLKVNPYRVKRIVEDRGHIGDQQLLDALYGLGDVDLQLKTMSGNRARFLEFFLMKPIGYRMN